MPKKSKREAGVGKRSGGAASNKVDLSGGSDDEDSLYNDAGSVSSMGISEVSTAVGEYRSSPVSIWPRAPAVPAQNSIPLSISELSHFKPTKPPNGR